MYFTYFRLIEMKAGHLMLMLVAGIFFQSSAFSQTQTKQQAEKKTKSYLITGTVEQVFQYCGGARPTEEMLDKLRKPVAYPGKKFFVRRGSVNSLKSKIIRSIISDSLGNFSVRLPAGVYSFITEEQVNALNPKDYEKENIQADNSCLKEWWEKPYYVLRIKNGGLKKKLNFSFQHRCFISVDIPCLNYTGPMPP